MIRTETGVHPDRIRQQASHCLFVEGESDDSFDVQVIQALLDRSGINIKVKALGPSHTIRGAAEALHKVHPDYYFLIDRDHQHDRFVAKCWKNFPDPRESNLLVWRRRELESYFIIPEYLSESPHLKKRKTKADLEQATLSCSQRRLYLDAANLVIITVRERLKEKWIEKFRDSACFRTEADALKALKGRPEWAKFGKKASSLLADRTLEKRLHETVVKLTGGQTNLEYGKGCWPELVKGKPVFRRIVNRLFEVRDTRGRFVQGSERLSQVAKELVRLPLENQPQDFQELGVLIHNRVTSGPL